MDYDLIKVVNKNKKFVTNNGKERYSFTYYLLVNGNRIAIKPIYDDGYGKLDLVAKVKIVELENTEKESDKKFVNK